MKYLLLENFKRHPEMKMEDMVKLIYQSVFGCGHIIDNAASSLERLKEEYNSLQSDENESFEDIGGGLSRLNLCAVKLLRLSLETVNGFCVGTANSVHGNAADFERKLELFIGLCVDSTFPYDPLIVKEYINGLREKGYPAVSHSDGYREKYHPAYRVVKNEYRDYIEVFIRIDALKSTEKCILVAVDGNSGSGKSALADILKSVYDCNVFHMDDFFLRPEQRTPERLEEPGGNVDYERFTAEIIVGINSGAAFSYRKYDCGKGAHGELVTAAPKNINIVEGSYSMHPLLLGNYDLKIFLKTSPEEQKKRIFRRNGKIMYERFVNEWIPLENMYFYELDIEKKCDIVYSTDNFTEQTSLQ
jgi:uridine kinase